MFFYIQICMWHNEKIQYHFKYIGLTKTNWNIFTKGSVLEGKYRRIKIYNHLLQQLSRTSLVKTKAFSSMKTLDFLTHLPLVLHICVRGLGQYWSDNGFSPIRRQVIIWTSSGILSTGYLGTNFTDFLITIQNFSFMKIHLKISSVKRWPFCPGGMS